MVQRANVKFVRVYRARNGRLIIEIKLPPVIKNGYMVSPPKCEAGMLESQGSVCAICGCLPPLCVDHNHVTGVVRGLLCRNCNLALGGFKDNPDSLRKAITYLESEFNEN